MPAKNRLKDYLPNGYYHIYNRGVEKRTIFVDEQDEGVFLAYLKTYLSAKNVNELMQIILDLKINSKKRAEAVALLRMNNFVDEIDLLAYCLMPNHFHLLIKQKNDRGIEKFMRSLGTRYVQYFNRRQNNRVGGLFQDAYKAVSVDSEEQLVYLSRYIHRNPASKGQSLKDCPRPSSYRNYLGLIKQVWVKPQEILSYFSNKLKSNSYKAFVEDEEYEQSSKNILVGIDLDN